MLGHPWELIKLTQTCDVAVIGAGIVGAACAYELAQAGLRVVVVEPNAIGSGATNLGYGSLCILDQMPGQLALTRYGLTLWDKLVEWLPHDCEYRRCGTVWIAFGEKQLEELALKSEAFNRRGIRVEELDARQLATAEPGLGGDVTGGLLIPDDGWLRASWAAEFLFQLATKKGAQHLRQRATAIQNHEVKLDDGSLLYAGNIVNAAGNDAATLTPRLPLTYSKGHVLVVETRAICAHHQLSSLAPETVADVNGQVRFVAYQKETGANLASEVWIGSSSQPIDNHTESMQVEPKIVAHLLRRAIEIVPAIGRAKPLRSWTGSRARTADGLPLIGRVAGPIASNDGLFVAAGHNGYGAATALATAKLIVAELMSQPPEIDPAPFRADRFRKDQL